MEELDLKELFKIFWNRRLEVVLITLIITLYSVSYVLRSANKKSDAVNERKINDKEKVIDCFIVIIVCVKRYGLFCTAFLIANTILLQVIDHN